MIDASSAWQTFLAAANSPLEGLTLKERRDKKKPDSEAMSMRWEEFIKKNSRF